MWSCKKCNTIIEEDEFDICWNCEHSKEDIAISEIGIHRNEVNKEESKMKIILSEDIEQSENKIHVPQKELTVKPNLFQGRTEADNGNAKFPDWDIVPPSQFINPRLKQ